MLKHKNFSSINTPGPYEQTPLYLGIHANNLAIVQELLQHPGIDVNSIDSSPLCQAINAGYWDIAHALLAHQGIDVNIESKRYGRPLCIAIMKKDLGMVQALLAHGKIEDNIGDNKPARDLAWTAGTAIREAVEEFEAKKRNSHVQALSFKHASMPTQLKGL